MARRSLSFGTGATDSGGCFTWPGKGGAESAGDAPPAPIASAYGPGLGAPTAAGEPGTPSGAGGALVGTDSGPTGTPDATGSPGAGKGATGDAGGTPAKS